MRPCIRRVPSVLTRYLTSRRAATLTPEEGRVLASDIFNREFAKLSAIGSLRNPLRTQRARFPLSEVFRILLATTRVEELFVGLVRLKLPYSLAFAFALALRWVPEIFDTANRVKEAQEARGLAWGSEPNLVPDLARLNRLLRNHPCFFDGAKLERISPRWGTSRSGNRSLEKSNSSSVGMKSRTSGSTT